MFVPLPQTVLELLTEMKSSFPARVKVSLVRIAYEHTEYWDPSTTAFPSALSTSSYSRSINGTVHEAGDWDHYQVSIQSNGTIALTLSNVPDGFDLQLYDFDGDLVGSSYTTGNEYINESISASGNYIIIVGSSQNDYSCTEYTLSLNWTPDAVPSTTSSSAPTSGMRR
jgi:hypothetical protein